MEYDDYDDYLEYAKIYQDSSYDDFRQIRELMVRDYDFVYFPPISLIISDDYVIE
jgi:hypothetical protein